MGRMTLLGAGGPPWDVDAQAYFAQLAPQPSLAFKQAINTLVIQLKSDGNWTLLDRLWIFAAEAQQNARISLVNPTSTPITEVNSPTWTVNRGYTGNGATMYLNTNMAANTGVAYTLDAASIGVYNRTAGNASSYAMGTANIRLRVSDAIGQISYQVNSNALSASAVAAATGLMVSNRDGAADQHGFRNGILQGTGAIASTAVDAQTIYILCRNDGTGLPTAFSSRQFSLAFIGGNLNQFSFYNAIQTFATARGFNV